MSDANKIMQALDVLMLLYGEVEVVDAESFLRGRLTFSEIMRAEVPDQIAALQYTTGYVEAMSHGEEAATDWVMICPPTGVGLRMITEDICNSLINHAHDTGELPLQPVAMEASYLLLEFLESFKRVLLAAVQEYPNSPRLRAKVLADLRVALDDLEQTGVIENLREIVVQESGQRMLV